MKHRKPNHPPNPLHVLAMGAGVQTTTILLMSIKGDLPRPDAVIFSDLRWEPPAVMRNLEWLNHKARHARIPFYILNPGNIRTDALRSHLVAAPADPRHYASMPLFTLDADGHKGMLRRQCTLKYKIRPIDNFIRQELLGIPKHKQCPPDRVHLAFGISTDEPNRIHTSEAKWKRNVYPLVDAGMSRRDCYDWLDRNNFHRPAKSSCVGCPYRSDAEWLWMRDHAPADFRLACDFDAAIRNPTTIRAQLFLHRQRIPLADVQLKIDPNKPPAPPTHTECWGYCGQ